RDSTGRLDVLVTWTWTPSRPSPLGRAPAPPPTASTYIKGFLLSGWMPEKTTALLASLLPAGIRPGRAWAKAARMAPATTWHVSVRAPTAAGGRGFRIEPGGA